MTEEGLPEETLAGGLINTVVRVGDTVRRRPSDSSPFVHRLLGRFEATGWPGAPRFLGIDGQGREILSYIPGHVDWDRAAATRHNDASLIAVAGLVRAFHDLTAGPPLADGQEVVCHNDLAPRNTVYRSATEPRAPFAFIDWDIAAPGRRIHDVAHACWQFIELGPAHPDPSDAARQVRLVADAYGLEDRGELAATILWWQDRCWRGIEAKADAGDAPMITLRDRGGAKDVRASFSWVEAHRGLFEAALK